MNGAIFTRGDGYTPLAENLAGLWDTPYKDLPSDLKPMIERAFGGRSNMTFVIDQSLEPGPAAKGQGAIAGATTVRRARNIAALWNKATASQRRTICVGYDDRHDPAHEPVMFFEVVKFSEELQHDWIPRVQELWGGSARPALKEVVEKLETIMDLDRPQASAAVRRLRAAAQERDRIDQELQALRAAHDAVVKERNALQESLARISAAKTPSTVHFSSDPQETPFRTQERETLLTIIGSLIELMLLKNSRGIRNSVFPHTAGIREALIHHFGLRKGISKSTLSEKFRIAKQLVTPE